MEKGTFKMAGRNVGPEPTTAYLTESGEWAVHKGWREWIISHAPSGFSVKGGYTTRAQAFEIAERLEATVKGPLDPNGQCFTCNQIDAIKKAVNPDYKPTCTEITSEAGTHRAYNAARALAERRGE